MNMNLKTALIPLAFLFPVDPEAFDVRGFLEATSKVGIKLYAETPADSPNGYFNLVGGQLTVVLHEKDVPPRIDSKNRIKTRAGNKRLTGQLKSYEDALRKAIRDNGGS